VHDNLPRLLPVLVDALETHKIRVGQPLLVRYGRVKLAEPIAVALGAELVVDLLGERPGGDALAARSLSAYLVYRPPAMPAQPDQASDSNSRPPFEYTVISNIHDGGLPPVEAGSLIAEKILQILAFRAAGNRLESLLERAGMSS
jgi:ethanolamine ammonia-lyase large subunit